MARFFLVALTLFFAVCILRVSDAGAAAQDVRFFSFIQDVPVMPGLRELPEQAVMFDNPEGRIVESVASIESAALDNLIPFYNDTLPQLGWAGLGGLSFRRDSEILKMTVESMDGKNFLRVTVSPAP